MNADLQDFKFINLTEKIIKIFYKVYNNLGYGFLEKIYENALIYEFRKANVNAVSQTPIQVFYEEEILGEYFTDILVEDKIILEIKAVKKLAEEHEAQLLNYLKATRILSVVNLIILSMRLIWQPMVQKMNSIIKQLKALSIFGVYLLEFGRKKLKVCNNYSVNSY